MLDLWINGYSLQQLCDCIVLKPRDGHETQFNHQCQIQRISNVIMWLRGTVAIVLDTVPSNDLNKTY